MKRSTFIKDTALSAMAVSAFGFLRFDGNKYIGDCETTTDILGPFYRPGSPVNNNLLIKGEHGSPVQLSGVIRHDDCKTPYANAKIELWHCDVNGIYDNTSDEFRYRGTTYTDEKGNYSFTTILPVAYDTGVGLIRPAHFHLMITATGYQSLVTQLYFTGDKYIPKDPYAASAKAKSRILKVQELKNGTKKVMYDISMAEKLLLESATIDKLTGTYTNTADSKKTIDFFKTDNALWMKNEAFGNKFEYTGNNSFEEANNPQGYYWKLEFEFGGQGVVKLTESYIDTDKSKKISVYQKNI